MSSKDTRLEIEEGLGVYEAFAAYVIAREFAKLDFAIQVFVGVVLVKMSERDTTLLLDRSLTRGEITKLVDTIGFPDVLAPMTVQDAWGHIVDTSMGNIRQQHETVLRGATGEAVVLAMRGYPEADRYVEKVTEEARLIKQTIIQNMNWSGTHFSDRIWDNSEAMRQKLRDVLSNEQLWNMTSRDLHELLGDLSQEERYNVIRLIRTEAAAMDSLASQVIAESLDIDNYILDATLDHRTSDICILKDGVKGKWEGARVGIELPPFHPHCRTIASFL